MYLRIRKIGNQCYLYINGNTRDNLSGRPTKKTLAYLGRLKDYSKKDVEKLKLLLKQNDPNLVDHIIRLNEKRKKKTISRKTNKRKVKKAGSKCIICGFDTVVHLHHLIPVSKGGLFNSRNLICLCPNHHALLHKGLINEDELKVYMKENKNLKGYFVSRGEECM